MVAEIAKKVERWATRLVCYSKGHQQPLIEVPRSWRKEARIRPLLKRAKVWRCPRCGKLVWEDTRKALVIDDGYEGE